MCGVCVYNTLHLRDGLRGERDRSELQLALAQAEAEADTDADEHENIACENKL